ncbi:olfactory receptor 14J1-like isoform 1-T1 [Amazona ochrocephala]
MGTVLPPSQSRGGRYGDAHCDGALTVSVGYLRSRALQEPVQRRPLRREAASALAALHIQIFRAVLRIPSEQGCHKAFSTCLPHLAMLSLLVSTSAFAYLKPLSISSPPLDLVLSVLYSVVPPHPRPPLYPNVGSQDGPANDCIRSRRRLLSSVETQESQYIMTAWRPLKQPMQAAQT